MTDGREHLAALKAAADPGRVADALGLKGRGKRYFCPVCQSAGGKTPDLAVADKGFTCHKCGLKGDLLKLVEVAAGLDFPKAVAWLESLTGIQAPRRGRGHGNKGRVTVASPARSWRQVSDAKPPKKVEAGTEAVMVAFLSACRPVEGPALAWMKKKVPNLTDALVEELGLRFCGREYLTVMEMLKESFGEDALVAAGLLKKSKTGRLVPSFWTYFAGKVGFLVIPYIQDGRPVYLKVRPLVSKEDADRLRLVRFLNTAAAVPCLYNADALVGRPDKVLVCEGESDTWTALSAGYAAVGSPGARNFKAAWTEGFRDLVAADGRSRVILALDADKAGKEGGRIIAELFRKAGLPIPLSLAIPKGKDLTEYLRHCSPIDEGAKSAETTGKIRVFG